MASVFFSYSHKDEQLRDQLETQLIMLKRQGVIDTWHDRRIEAGGDFANEIDQHVESDDIILLLASPDFLASDYCYEREMSRAMERHDRGEAVVIPVVLRACEWKHAPFGKLNACPPDGKPITQYPDRDQGFLEIAKAVRAAAERLNAKAHAAAPKVARRQPAATSQVPRVTPPRSSNLSVARQFTQRDRDEFRYQAFEYMAKFFENSLAELKERNPGIETRFRRVDANRFSASVYRDGQAVSRCTVFIGGAFGNDCIGYSSAETDASNSYNAMLTIESDDHSIYMRQSLSMTQDRDAKLTEEGASEAYWDILIEPLKRGR